MPRLTKQQRERQMLEALAYHEAGHAVMAINYRRSIRWVSIVPDPERGSLGHVSHPNRYRSTFQPEWSTLDGDARFQTACIREILISLAGPAAEAHFTGRPNAVGAESDMDFVYDLVERVCGEDEGKPFIEWLTLRARREITHHLAWVQVEGLARALLLEPKMSGKEAMEACSLAAIDSLPEKLRAETLELRAEHAAMRQKRTVGRH